ncbi:MAG TPA: hypothetical protein PKE34_10040, partial [Marmoricola sp.]|nr:hypothetical protein [Marmoricola sp.]
IDVVIHLGRTRSGKRLIREIGVLVRREDAVAVVEQAVTFVDGQISLGPGIDLLRELVDK